MRSCLETAVGSPRPSAAGVVDGALRRDAQVAARRRVIEEQVALVHVYAERRRDAVRLCAGERDEGIVRDLWRERVEDRHGCLEDVGARKELADVARSQADGERSRSRRSSRDSRVL